MKKIRDLWDDIYIGAHVTNPSLTFFPIIKPYEEDSVFCDTVPNFHLHSMRVGYPTFAWDTNWLREEDRYEVQFAPYHPGTATPDNQWLTETTTDSSIAIYSVFDPDIYYQARIRARRHHLCPIHDTLMWGPWSRPILFYSGPTEPDTTTAIPTNPQSSIFNPQFSITPNPTTGHITITLNSSSPMRVVSSGDHEGDEAKIPRSRATKTTQKTLSRSRRDGGVCTLSIRDAAGHELIKQKIPSVQKSIELNLSGYPSGTYYITLSTPTASSTQRLLFK